MLGQLVIDHQLHGPIKYANVYIDIEIRIYKAFVVVQQNNI